MISAAAGGPSEATVTWEGQPLLNMNGEEALPCLAAYHHASIGIHYLAAQVARIIARQEKEAGGDLIGLARPSHRCALAEMLHLFRSRAAKGIKQGPDGSGCNAVHPNALVDAHFR